MRAAREYVDTKNEQSRADGRWAELVYAIADDAGPDAGSIRSALDEYLERLDAVRKLAQAYAAAAIAALGEANE